MRLLSVVAMAAFLSCTASADPQPALKRKGPGFMKKGPIGPPPDVVERFSQLSPTERQEALSKLPPARREMMERRLERWNQTPVEQRRRLAGSYAQFQEMSPEKQHEVRRLFRRFGETFPPEKRPEAQAAIRRLRKADPEERKTLLNSRRFVRDFSDDERKLLEQMATEIPGRE
jgi:formate dehydrogenase maturation protein FdhE